MRTVTKKELARIIRDVCSGISGHTIGSYRKNGRRYDVETTVGNQYPYEAPAWARFKHERNEMTLKEAVAYINA